jgi:cytochrome b561
MRTALTRTDRYSKGAIWFHWVIAALVLANLTIGLLHESLLDFDGVIPLHKSIGITVLVLTLGRIAWRLAHRPPAPPATIARWERLAAGAAHMTLYALLLILPLTGWLMVSGATKRRPFGWFGLFDIPLFPVSTTVGDVAHGTHEVLGYLTTLLVAIHIAAALRHHFLLRDSVLARMIPGVGAQR